MKSISDHHPAPLPEPGCVEGVQRISFFYPSISFFYFFIQALLSEGSLADTYNVLIPRAGV